MLELFREIQTYKENREDYTAEERKMIRADFRQRIKEIARSIEVL